MKILFAGTPTFAEPTLTALLKSNHTVVAVLTQPDKPAGRGRHLQFGPIKQLALMHDLPILQPLHLKASDIQQTLLAFDADVMVVVAYGLILPSAVLTIPRLGCINLHPSLLPYHRGAAPIQATLLAGETTTALTIIQMDAGMDTGPILYQEKTPILPEETCGDLHHRLAIEGAQCVIKTLDLLEHSAITPRAQPAGASYSQKIQKEDARIDWHKSAQTLLNEIRAYNPWPVSFTHFNEKTLRIFKAKIVPGDPKKTPGSIVLQNKNTLAIQTGENALSLLEVQLPGSKPICITDFMNGHPQLNQGFL